MAELARQLVTQRPIAGRVIGIRHLFEPTDATTFDSVMPQGKIRVGLPLSSILGVDDSFSSTLASTRLDRNLCDIATRSLSSYTRPRWYRSS